MKLSSYYQEQQKRPMGEVITVSNEIWDKLEDKGLPWKYKTREEAEKVIEELKNGYLL